MLWAWKCLERLLYLHQDQDMMRHLLSDLGVSVGLYANHQMAPLSGYPRTRCNSRRAEIVIYIKKFSLCLWGVWGNGYIAPHVLDLDTSWDWSASCPGRFIREERVSGIHWIGDWVGLRTSLNMRGRKIVSLAGFELLLLGLPARSQLLYRLS
jgi:hypothetical protein